MAMNLSSPEFVEIERRSVAMLSPKAWGMSREQALDVLEALRDALDEIRRLRGT